MSTPAPDPSTPSATPEPEAPSSPAVDVTVKTHLWAPLGFRVHLGVILALGTVALLVFANSFGNGFADQNKFVLLEDTRLQEVSWKSIVKIFTQDYRWPAETSGLYRPITTLTFWFNYSVLGNAESPAGYHAINWLLHWGNGILVYLTVLVVMGNIWPALFAAALFVAHPATTDAVANTVGRAELLGAAAVLGGFLLYAKSTVIVGWRRVLWLLGLAAVAAVGIFAHENVVVLIGVMVLYDLVYRLEPLRSNPLANLVTHGWRFFWKGYLAVLPAFFGLWYVRRLLFSQTPAAEVSWMDNPLVTAGTDFWTQRLTAIKVIGKYFWLLIWPADLSPDYSYNHVPLVDWNLGELEIWKAFVGLAAIVVLCFVVLKNLRRNKPLVFFIAFFFVTLLPVANLIRPTSLIMAERFLYLPLLGFSGLLVVTTYQVCRRVVIQMELSDWATPLWLQISARTLLCLIIAGYGVRAFIRNFDWKDDTALWSAAVRVAPDSYKTHQALAFALYQANPEHEDIDRLIEEGEKAMAITDQNRLVLLHLGAYYAIKGDQLSQRAPDGAVVTTPQSREWYQKSVEVLLKAKALDQQFNRNHHKQQLQFGRSAAEIGDVGNNQIYYNLGFALMRLEQYDQAAAAYEQWRHLVPSSADPYLNIANANLLRGRLGDAVISLLQAMLVDNSRQEPVRLLEELYRQIDREGCAIIYSAGQPRLNNDCQLVANHICTAYRGLVGIFMNAKQYPLAFQIRDNAVKLYRCDPMAFDALLASAPRQRTPTR